MERAELFLKLSDVGDSLDRALRHGTSEVNIPVGLPTAIKPEVPSLAQEFLKAAASECEAIVRNEPDNARASATLVVLGHRRKLASVQGFYKDLSQSKNLQAKTYLIGLNSAYGLQGGPKTDAQVDQVFLENHLPSGWCCDHAILDWQARTGQRVSCKATEEKIERQSLAFLIDLALLIAFGSLAFFSGLLILLWQLFHLGRQFTPDRELPLVMAAADYGWLNIYKVFVFWLLTQVLIGWLSAKFLRAHLANDQALVTAFSTMGLYSTANLPVVFYLYWFALRPCQIPLLEGIKVRLKIGGLGPVRMIGCGVIAWCACFPLVSVAYAIAVNYLGSHGSTNPVVNQLKEVAQAQDPIAVSIFYLTIAVIAPICEESLFRGFLYPALRRGMKAPTAIIASAATFALAHLDLGAALPLFALGCVFAFAVEKTKSIVPSIVAHGLWNAGSFTLVLLLFGN
jgi:membrane protease YdiL (CAAX protease family)